MTLRNKTLSMPAYRTRTVGTNSIAVVGQGSIDNGYFGCYGQLEAIPANGTWRNKLPLAGKALDYPMLFTERTIDLLNDGLINFFSTNPITRLPPKTWGTRGTLIRPPKAVLFTPYEGQSSNPRFPTISIDFINSIASVLDKHNAIATNKIDTFYSQNTFGWHPLQQGLIFGTTAMSSTTLGDEEVGVVVPESFHGGMVYEVIITNYLPWIDFGDHNQPLTELNDHYIAQQQVAFPRFEKKKRVTYFIDIDTFTPGITGKAECVRASAELGGYGFDAPIIFSGSVAAQETAMRSALLGLSADIDAFFSDT